jgi:hypothetical protein
MLNHAIRSVDCGRELAIGGVDVRADDDLTLVATHGHLDLPRYFVLVHECDPCEATWAHRSSQHFADKRGCAFWSIRNGVATELIASVTASLPGCDIVHRPVTTRCAD